MKKIIKPKVNFKANCILVIVFIALGFLMQWMLRRNIGASEVIIWKLFQTAFFFDAYAVLNSSINYKVLEGKIFGGVSNVILIVVLVATNRFTSIVLYLGIVMLIFIGTIKLNRLLIMILTMSFYELIVLFGLFVVYKFTGIFTNNEMEISWLSIIYGYLTLTFIIYLKIGVAINKFFVEKLNVDDFVSFDKESFKNTLMCLGLGVFIMFNIYNYSFNIGNYNKYDLINNLFLSYVAMCGIQWDKVFSQKKIKEYFKKL